MILNYSDTGNGPVCVLLHGMAASLHYWQSYTPLLADTHRVIAIDLMGFGRSPAPHAGYTVAAHCQAIKDTLDHLGVHEPITLAGHSMGALLALKYADIYADSVSKLVLLSPPLYKTPEEAKRDITKSKKILEYAFFGPTSHVLCTTWCYCLRPLSKRIAPLYLKHQPHQIAQDSVLHSWQSYSESMWNVIQNQSVEKDLDNLKIPITLVYGDAESKIILNNARAMKLNNNIDLLTVRGMHNFPLEQPQEIIRLIQ
jgi:cis-3-alkyl-4-acyloxetan-2-one decarboxylase